MMLNQMDYKERTKKSFDAKASNYFDTYDGKYCRKVYDRVLQKLSTFPCQSILDVGCGTGDVISMILSEREVDVAGIDISPEMIKKAKELLGEDRDLRVGDSENLTWDDDCFDVIICTASFHHYPNPKESLLEMKRVLKDGGTIIITDPWWRNPRRAFINLYIKTPFNKNGDVRIYSKDEMYNLLSECGFTPVSWETPVKGFGMTTGKVSK